METQKITILDFTNGEVLIRDYDNFYWDNEEDFIESLGLKQKDCQWMITNKLKLTIE